MSHGRFSSIGETVNKHRIVGLVVLVALIVILTEFLLNYRLSTENKIPEIKTPPAPELLQEMHKKQDVPIIEIPDITPQKDTSLKEEGSLQQEEQLAAPIVDEEAIPLKPSAAPVVAKQLAKSWVVQVASYNDETHAKNLVSKLQKAKFEAFSYATMIRGKLMYRVSAGPVASSAEATEIKDKLTNQLKINGFVTRYTSADEL